MTLLLESQHATAFANDVERHVLSFQRAVRKMLEQWGSPSNANELDRISGAGTTICWQVFRVANTDQVLAEARNVPTPQSLKRLLTAAEKAGVTDSTLREVLDAAEGFRALGKSVAPDRAAFDSMLAGLNSEPQVAKILMSQRRASYRAMSHIRGRQTDLVYYMAMLKRSDEGDTYDGVSITMQRGYRRLRPDDSLNVIRTLGPSAETAIDPEHLLDAMDPEATRRYGMPIIARFSSESLPRVAKHNPESGYTIYRMLDTEVGTQSTYDCTFGLHRRKRPFIDDIAGRRVYAQSYVYSKPVALGVHELIIHRPSFPNARPEMLCYQISDGNPTMIQARNAEQIPIHERVVRVGPADSANLAEVPQYTELLSYCAEQCGWNLSEFEVWRLKMQYPISYSSVRLFFNVD